ncbi:MobQ family relaxase [Bacillus sp. ISL-57]|uniref:MobQ family relaxase n=1 Tax=Bacillus sp. ISL-57 TaxID=2819135 RepID=UPI001BED34DE|nr:MobQ family relaxase [Bacillus sp. ISL-57]MBT2719015.1 MobA/MobL family protein [Bacillus sp. ISL-57]
MAIYHFSAQVISRSKGQSAVASAAYRSGERLTDERTDETKFYKREVQPETMILAPSQSPEWVQDRQQLWNEVEKAETRKNSQVAREINIALPRELSHQEQVELIRGYVQKEFVDQGMIADVAIHRDDKENPHAHVMLTTREISKDGFTVKNRDWNKKELLVQWREQWAEHANKSLEREGIQDRISHESHEKRNLIIFPTVHLGHVAHEMEKRGVQTDRGTINRDRQEYNRLVVNLQKYREEKKALQQEKAWRQEQRQKSERFNTPAERVHLQEASKLLNVDREPTLKEIFVKRKELDQWENQVHNEDQQIRWKDETIRGASETYRWIHIFENQRQQAQQQLETINWMNPFKLKENRMTKEQAELEMSKAEDQITLRDKTLHSYREKLGFHTEKEFHQMQSQYQTDYPGLLEKNRQTRGQINRERDVLKKAETAHQNAFVRQVASLYPERPEMLHISLETAKKLMDINQANGNKVVPLETIQKTLHNRKEEIQRLQGELNRVNQHRSRLQRAEGYLENYETQHAVVEKIENNPFLKGKLLVSKSAKQEYEQAISTRENSQDSMKKEGVSGRKDLEKQFHTLGKMEARVPAFKDQIQSQEKGLGLLEGIMNGVEQAGRDMQMEQKRQQQKTSKVKINEKKRNRGWEMER